MVPAILTWGKRGLWKSRDFFRDAWLRILSIDLVVIVFQDRRPDSGASLLPAVCRTSEIPYPSCLTLLWRTVRGSNGRPFPALLHRPVAATKNWGELSLCSEKRKVAFSSTLYHHHCPARYVSRQINSPRHFPSHCLMRLLSMIPFMNAEKAFMAMLLMVWRPK